MCTFLLQSDTLWDSSDASWDFWDGYIIAIHGMQFSCQVFFLNPRPVEQIQCKSLHACLCFILLPYNALNEHSLTSLNFTQAGQVIKLTVLFFVVLRHWYDISKNSKSLNIPLSDFPKWALGFLLCIKFASSTVIAFFFALFHNLCLDTSIHSTECEFIARMNPCPPCKCFATVEQKLEKCVMGGRMIPAAITCKT